MWQTEPMVEDAIYDCDVCLGMGTYPIINRHGQDLYAIPCPECHRPALVRLATTDDVENQRGDSDTSHRPKEEDNRP